MCHCILIRYTDTATSDNWQTDTRAYTRPIVNTSLSVTDYRVYWKCLFTCRMSTLLCFRLNLCYELLHSNNVFSSQAALQLLYLFSISAFFTRRIFLWIIPDIISLGHKHPTSITLGHKTRILRKFEEIKIQTVLQFIFPVPVFIFTQNINFWKLTSTLPL